MKKILQTFRYLNIYLRQINQILILKYLKSYILLQTLKEKSKKSHFFKNKYQKSRIC